LALLHDRAFLHQDVADNAAFQALHHLGLSRRHHSTVAAFDLFQNRKVRPDQKS